MTSARHRTRLVPVLMSAALVLTGCGDDSGGGSSAPASSTPLTPAQINLRAADLPTEWTVAAADTGNSTGGRNEVTQCSGLTRAQIRAADAAKVAKVESEEFKNGRSSIKSVVETFRSQQVVDRDAAGLVKRTTIRCMAKVFRNVFAEAVAPAKIVKFSADFAPGGYATKNVVGTLTMPVTAASDSLQLRFVLQLVFITGPKLEASLFIFGVGAAIPRATRVRAVEAVAARAARG